MKTLIETLFFQKIQEIANGAESSDSELQKMLDEFISRVVQMCDTHNGKTLLRLLNYTRLQLITLQEEYSGEVKKTLAERCINIAILYIEAEINTFHLSLTYPDRFLDVTAKPQQSPLKLARCVKLADLVELFTCFDLLELVEFTGGGKASFSKLIEGVEWLFNTSLGNCYEKKEDILIRKRQRTKFIDKLKVALEEHNRNNFTPNR